MLLPSWEGQRISSSLLPYKFPIKRKQPFPITQPTEDAQPQNPPLSSQQKQAKEPEAPQGASSDKVAEALQPGAASQSFEKELALTTLPVGGASKEKEKEIPPEAIDKAPKSKVQIKLKP